MTSGSSSVANDGVADTPKVPVATMTRLALREPAEPRSSRNVSLSWVRDRTGVSRRIGRLKRLAYSSR